MNAKSIIMKLAPSGAVLAGIVFLASCTVAVDEGGPARPGPGPQMCTREYAPVCAQRGRDRETFPNACTARARGYDVAYPGECRRGGDRDGRADDRDGRRDHREGRRGDHDRRRGDRDDRPRSGGPQMCTQQYDPVCARRGGNVRSFGNACEARSADYRVVHPGRC